MKRRKSNREEDRIQKTVFQHLHMRAHPAVFYFHVPNGGKREPTEAAILKGLGVTPGVPDIIAIYRGKCFALELKAPNGRPTEAQLEAIWSLERAGAYTCIAYGLDAALKALESWGILRGRVNV